MNAADKIAAGLEDISILDTGLVRLKGRDIQAKRLMPLWPGVLYRNKVAIIAGLPGDGKSLITTDIVARISRGDHWPTCDLRAPKGYAIMITAEDEQQDTIRPRLDAAKADPDRYEIITGVKRTDDKTGEFELDTVSLIDDLPKIEAVIAETSATIVIIDPLT